MGTGAFFSLTLIYRSIFHAEHYKYITSVLPAVFYGHKLTAKRFDCSKHFMDKRDSFGIIQGLDFHAKYFAPLLFMIRNCRQYFTRDMAICIPRRIERKKRKIKHTYGLYMCVFVFLFHKDTILW